IVIPPRSAIPTVSGNSTENPRQFLIRDQEYTETVYAWDGVKLLNGISQFLRGFALEWYCQLRLAHRRPQNWTEFSDLFLIQFNSPVRKALQEQEWHHCFQEEDETINEFLVRLRGLWREQRPKETESDLVKHLFCRMRTELLNMIGISRNASLDEVITEAQQIEDILYRRSQGERLTERIKETETLSKKYDNTYTPGETPSGWNNKLSNYPVNEAEPCEFTNDQNHTTVTPKNRQSVNSPACCSCGGYECPSNYSHIQHDNYRQQQNTSKSKNNRGALDERTRPAPF
ncbi:unnamed protein product, partial [Adineta ricciae]